MGNNLDFIMECVEKINKLFSNRSNLDDIKAKFAEMIATKNLKKNCTLLFNNKFSKPIQYKGL